MNKIGKIAAISVLALSVFSCQKAAEPTATAPTSGTALPVSINATMVGLVDHSADYLFALGNGDLPRNENDWHLVLSSAYETMLSGAVIQIPGTGPNDGEWVKNPEWIRLSKELTGIGAEAVKLSEAKSANVDDWRAVGDKLIQNCLACHEQFKPEIPSEGILRGSTERQSRGESIFGY